MGATSRLNAAIDWLFGLYSATPPALADGDAAPLATNKNGGLVMSAYDRQTYTVTAVVGTLGGAALPADPDPNVTDPGAKAVRLTQATGLATGAGASAAFANPLDGTSLIIQLWIYDDTLAKWFKFAGTATCPANTGTSIGSLGGALVGARFFPQIVTNNGNVSQYFWYFR